MSVGDECPVCEAPLGPENLCQRCGWKSEAVARAEQTAAVPDDARRARRWAQIRDDAQCAHGKTVGPRCPFRASSFEVGAASGYCTWHREVLREPRVNVFEEFARFCAKLKGPDDFEVLELLAERGRLLPSRYCTLWTHYTPGELWDAMQAGKNDLPAPRPCFSPSCPYQAPQMTDEQVAIFRDRVRRGGWDAAVQALVRRP